MVSIVVLGGKSGYKLAELLWVCLGHQGPAALCTPEKVFSPDSALPLEYLVCLEEEPVEIRGEKTILIFTEHYAPSVLPKLFGEVTAVVSSQNQGGLAVLAQSPVKTITCGLSSKDTVTLVSHTEEGVMVAFQRALDSFQGERVEPMELPIKGVWLDNRYLFLAACTALALVGGMKMLDYLPQFLESISDTGNG